MCPFVSKRGGPRVDYTRKVGNEVNPHRANNDRSTMNRSQLVLNLMRLYGVLFSHDLHHYSASYWYGNVLFL